MLVSVVILAFMCWAAAFIYRSTVPLFDGGRTFCLFDDAMVSMRYAENLANGNGPVWNPGEFVEGYTNPLMVGVMALGLTAFSKPIAVLFVQVLGALLVLFTALLSVRIYKRIAEPNEQAPAWYILPFVFAIYTLSYWAIMGMETGFVAFFLALGVATVGEQRQDQKKSATHQSVLLGLSGVGLYLSRPDAVLYAIVILAFYFLADRRFKPAFVVLAIIGGAIAMHLAFRLVYYGDIAPNTAVLKLGGFPLSSRIRNGVGYIVPFMQGVFPLLILASVSAIMQINYLKCLVLSLLAVSIGYQVYVGGDPWIYWRIMSPVMPLLVVLATDGALRLSARMISYDKAVGRIADRRTLLVPAACVMIWAVHQYDKPFLLECLLLQKPRTTEANTENVNTALAIRDLTKGTASVGVFWAGSIPFYAERYAVDFLGKSDSGIANRPPDLTGAVSWNGMFSVPGHNKYDLRESIIKRKPTYIQGSRWCRDDVSGWVGKHYVSVSHRGATLLLLKDSPDVMWERVQVPHGKAAEMSAQEPAEPHR